MILKDIGSSGDVCSKGSEGRLTSRWVGDFVDGCNWDHLGVEDSAGSRRTSILVRRSSLFLADSNRSIAKSLTILLALRKGENDRHCD